MKIVQSCSFAIERMHPKISTSYSENLLMELLIIWILRKKIVYGKESHDISIYLLISGEIDPIQPHA